MQTNDEFRALLEAGDFAALVKAWAKVAPHLPQPKSLEAAEVTMHMARTASTLVSRAARQYSHRWLTERNLPSQLPGDLLPKIVEAVGISVNFGSPYLKPAAIEVRAAMEDAVNDCYANGDRAVAIVRKQMDIARDRTMKALFAR